MIEFLIENNADVNSKSISNRTPLMYSIIGSKENYQIEIIKLLIKKSNNINCKDLKNETALIICSEYIINNLVRHEITKLLLDNKADIYIKNNDNENILNLIENTIGCDSDIYSLIFNYKNLINDHFCEYDINFIYNIKI